jgi:hypothetical protein
LYLIYLFCFSRPSFFAVWFFATVFSRLLTHCSRNRFVVETTEVHPPSPSHALSFLLAKAKSKSSRPTISTSKPSSQPSDHQSNQNSTQLNNHTHPSRNCEIVAQHTAAPRHGLNCLTLSIYPPHSESRPGCVASSHRRVLVTDQRSS